MGGGGGDVLVGKVGSCGCADGGWCCERVGDRWGWLDGADVIGRHHCAQLLCCVPLLPGFLFLGLGHAMRSWRGSRSRRGSAAKGASCKLGRSLLRADEVKVVKHVLSKGSVNLALHRCVGGGEGCHQRCELGKMRNRFTKDFVKLVTSRDEDVVL